MKKIAFGLIVALFISCENNDEVPIDPETFRIDMVTGLNIRNESGDIVETWGNPNVYGYLQMKIGPIPARETIRIESSLYVIDNIYIVRASHTREFSDVDYNQAFINNPVQIEEVQTASTRTFSDLDVNEITIDVSELPQGYYRVFVEANGGYQILSENIYLDRTNNTSIHGINVWD